MMFRRRSILILSAGALLTAAAMMALGGCGSQPRTRPKPKPKPAKDEPVEIDWSSPASVVDGFFDAKKRGDWRKAYSCCDFEERLSKEEAREIRDEWKREAKQWPEMYANSLWIVQDFETDGDYALVAVVLIESGGLGSTAEERTGFEELCKLYDKRWKITEFDLPPDWDSE
jgi:hypothetical protein